MASSDDTQLVMRGILEGARDILIKPLRVEELRVLWQHLVRSTSELTKTEVRLPASVRDELMDGNIPYGEASTNQVGLVTPSPLASNQFSPIISPSLTHLSLSLSLFHTLAHTHTHTHTHTRTPQLFHFGYSQSHDNIEKIWDW
jgi:DNA-binding response OmpR family regulator